MDSLVSTEWLAQHLNDNDLRIVDASWHMPATNRSGRSEYGAQHIPGAVFLDIDELSDRSNPAPHMLPTAEQFGWAMGELGISRNHRILVYDNSPLRTAARGWFMFRHFGADQVAILDGGFQKWIAEGRPVESEAHHGSPTKFVSEERGDEVVTKRQIVGGFASAVLDARGKGRFEGSEPDPRLGVAPGHMPGARNLPFASLYREDGTFKSPEQLRALFADAGIDPEAPFVATCGSGITANSLIFAAHLLGNETARLYDGSWSEWGSDPETPKALGPA